MQNQAQIDDEIRKEELNKQLAEQRLAKLRKKADKQKEREARVLEAVLPKNTPKPTSYRVRFLEDILKDGYSNFKGQVITVDEAKKNELLADGLVEMVVHKPLRARIMDHFSQDIIAQQPVDALPPKPAQPKSGLLKRITSLPWTYMSGAGTAAGIVVFKIFPVVSAEAASGAAFAFVCGAICVLSAIVTTPDGSAPRQAQQQVQIQKGKSFFEELVDEPTPTVAWSEKPEPLTAVAMDTPKPEQPTPSYQPTKQDLIEQMKILQQAIANLQDDAPPIKPLTPSEAVAAIPASAASEKKGFWEKRLGIIPVSIELTKSKQQLAEDEAEAQEASEKPPLLKHSRITLGVLVLAGSGLLIPNMFNGLTTYSVFGAIVSLIGICFLAGMQVDHAVWGK